MAWAALMRILRMNGSMLGRFPRVARVPFQKHGPAGKSFSDADGIIDFMRHSGHESAQRFHFLGLVELDAPFVG